MKITAIIMLTALLQVSAKGLSQKITLSEKDAPLEKVFDEIRKQTGYTFVYKSELLNKAKKIDIKVEDVTLEAALEICFKDQPLTYKIFEKIIAVKSKDQPVTSTLIDLPPPIDIHGRIVNEESEPVAGVSVKIKGTQQGTTTNGNGEFSLAGVDENSVLVFTGTNIEAFEATVKGKTDFNFVAKTKVGSLEEVVVNKGYYRTSQRLNTGNVTRVDGADIQKQPVSDPIMALEARVPGLDIQQSSGIPGANMTVRIRGKNSIANGNDPLYIVDGVPFSSVTLTNNGFGGGAVGYPSSTAALNSGQPQGGLSPFNNLNPADIESIEVLKDADATAIYGSRGANGVILITTKKGKSGDTKFLANVYSGNGNVTRKMHLLNTEEYLKVRHQAFINDGKTPKPSDYDINGTWDTTRYTDWQKVLFGGTSKFTNAQLSMSGGTANTQFYIGGGYSRQTTVFPGNYLDQKASVYINLTHSSANQKFRIATSAGYVSDNNVIPQADFTASLNQAPDAPPLYDANGKINWENGTFNNPLVATSRNARAITNTLTGSLNLSYEIFKGLQLKTSLGYTSMQMNQTNQQFAWAAYGPPNPGLRRNQYATSNLNNWIIEPQLDYSKRIGHGNLDILIGTTHQQNNQNSIAQLASGFASDALISNVSAATYFYLYGAQVSEYHYVAFFGRVNYNWKDKYLINVTARRDGSSRFGPDKQFGNFGAVGVGWIFSKEKFIERNLPFLSFGKLRASYGTTGNDQIGDYQFISTYSSYYGTPYQGVSTLYPTILSNATFAWEIVKKTEGGLELGFLKDRISLIASYYYNRSGNQLIGQPLPYVTGFNRVQANLPATVQNAGTEIVLNTINIQSKVFTWSTSFNLSIPRNKLVSFPGLSNNAAYNLRYAIGKSLFIWPLLHYTGIDKQTGVYTVEDLNHDGIINSQDLQLQKQISKDYFGGMQNSFSYRGWRLDFLIQFVKQTSRNYLANFYIPGLYGLNQPIAVLGAWQNPGDNANIQKYTQTGGLASTAYTRYASSDASISDGSFLRVKNISLSYNLPESWQKKMHLKNSRVYLLAQNILTITGYQGLDPETAGLSLPPLRMITAGIQIGF